MGNNREIDKRDSSGINPSEPSSAQSQVISGGQAVDSHLSESEYASSKGNRRLRGWMLLIPLGVFLLVLSVFVTNGATKPGISYERVSFTTEGMEAEPVTISGLLMKPAKFEGTKMPGVIFSNGITGSKEWYIQLTRPLVLKGMVVLAIDLRGHGGSSGYCTFGNEEVKDVLAAANYLAGNVPEVDPSKIFAMGHSLGGITSTRAGALQPDRRISGVVAIYCWTSLKDALEDTLGSIDNFLSRFWRFVTFSKHIDINAPDLEQKFSVLDITDDTRPPNYLLEIGSADELASVSREEELIEKMTVQARSSGTEQKVKAGYTYGNFADGTARRLFVSNDDHATELASGPILLEASNWIKESSGIPTDPNERPQFLWARLGGIVLFAVSLFFISLGILSLVRRKLFPDGGLGIFEFPWEVEGKGIREVAIYAIAVISASYLSFVCAKAFGIGPFIPYAGVGELSIFYLTRAIVLLPVIASLIFALIVHAGGLKGFLSSLGGIARRWGRAAVYALIPLVITILFMLILSGSLILPRTFPRMPGFFILGTVIIGAGLWIEDYLFYRIACPALVRGDDTRRAIIFHGVVLDLVLVFSVLPLMKGLSTSVNVVFKIPLLLVMILATPAFIFVAWLSMRLRRLTGTSLTFVLMFVPLLIWIFTGPVGVRGF